MCFKALILSNFVSIIIILDTFMWYFMLQVIARALESKEERKDAKGTKKKKIDECYSIGDPMPQHWKKNQNWKQLQCRSIEDPMPQHWEKEKNLKIGRMVNAAALSTQCCSMRGSWKIEDSMPQH